MKHFKKTEKFNIWPLYLSFVLLLCAVMGFGLLRLWDFCERYQANCAETLLRDASQRLSEEYGLDLSFSPVPRLEEDGSSSFTLREGQRPVGRIRLGVKERGPMSLVLYELRDWEGILSFEVEAPEGIIVKSAGRELLPLEEEIFPGLESLASFEGDRKPPMLCRYRAEGLLSSSQIEAEARDRALEREEDGSNIRMIPRDAASDAKEIKERALEIAGLYSKYISKDVPWSTLSANIMEGSPLKSRIPSLEIQWYNWHDSSEIRDPRLSEPLPLERGYVLVNARYDYVIHRSGKEYSYPTELALYLHRDGDGVLRLAELMTHCFDWDSKAELQ